tara:strand:+ start:327 stop:506 length:180 start_codon:yes stop_codon:yes gene_type:complete
MELITITILIVLGMAAHVGGFIIHVLIDISNKGLNIFNGTGLVLVIVGPIWIASLFMSI